VIVFERIEFIHIGQFSIQLCGSVDQDRKMFGADVFLSAFIKEYNQGNLVVVSLALDAGVCLVFCHCSLN
jgi:hypothetical protein